MFVGRERELAVLDRAYATKGFHMIPIYGRRRVGKTSLIHRFVAQKQRVYFFTAQQTIARENLAAFSAALATEDAYPGPGLYPGTHTFPGSYIPENYPVYRTFREALTVLFDRSRGQRVICVIDEYPYLAESYPGISSLLQTLIDQYRDESQLFLILCGSSMSFMEEQVLGEKSPLYGRRTAQIKLEPFDVFDAHKLFGNPDAIKSVELYALVGGVPLYVEQLDAEQTVAWNVASRLLPRDGLLSQEPENFLLQEVRTPAGYHAVIESLAHGCVTPQTIADRTAMNAPLVSQYLDRLGRLGVVRKRTPVPNRKKRKVRYEIADNLFRFHYRFGIKYLTAIEAGMSEAVTERIMGDAFPTFVGPVFEDVCRQWLLRQAVNGALDILPLEIGSWWGANPRTREQEEIDVVMCGDGDRLVVGECKWRSSMVDVSVLNTLRRRAALLEGGENAELYVFSKSGFDAACSHQAKEDRRIHLVGVEELFS